MPDMPLDLSAGLPDIDPDAPAGPNLELDGEFGALERAAQGSPEKQYGDKVIPAEDPNWKDVAAQAAALLERTYDLRVLAHLAIARLNLTGLADFVAVLTTIRQLLETRWEHVHPQLDPEDDNDPTLRSNALLQLGHPMRVLRVLRNMPLATSQRAGAATWRIIGAMTGALQDPDAPKLTEGEIRAAFIDSGAAKVGALRECLATGIREIAAIGAAFDTNSGYGNGPALDPLTKLLREMFHYIELYAEAGDTPAEDAAGEGDASQDGGAADPNAPHNGPSGGASPRAGGVSAASLTSVSTRADALRLLDIVCRYYTQHEPSSPLPLMIGRARMLADKTFLEILQDLAPDGLHQATSIVQPRES
jgi:type VI secretion system protein ImpA